MKKVLLLSLLGSTAAMAQVSAPLVTKPTHHAVSQPVEQIAMQAQASAFEVKDFRVMRDHKRGDKVQTRALAAAMAAAVPAPSVTVSAGSPFLQTATFQPLGAPIGKNFEALGVGTPGFAISGAPPDTTLAVSPTQIVQWVNSQFAVYNKRGRALLPAPGFLNGNVIWSGLPSGSLCKQFNRGDPIVQYDRHAQRWILSQFAFTSNFGNNAQCIAVSTTSNALGSYNLYEYNFGNALPDYGKLGVWTDAYFITYNMFGNATTTFDGGRACAYDKATMLVGGAATQICFNSAPDFSFLPSDLEGSTPPPAGTPNIHVAWNWYNTAPPYTMQLHKFKPDFANPANSTFDDGFGGPTFSFVAVELPDTLGPCSDAGSGTGFRCVPQAGTTQTLDTLGDRHMYRLVYRNFGSYDSLLITQTVDATGQGNVADLHWMEIRNPAANPPVIFQNSTFVADSTARWMSSAAFDKLGNIGIGYSASSSAINPGIRVTGRRRTDAKNVLRTEQVVQNGTGSQTTGLSRWGDYSTMQIDPADDCTFWYTTQYIAANGTFNWNTRIASFKFPTCR